MNRWLVVAALLVPNCTGCLGYAYPGIVYVPELTVPNPDNSVYAFRVDVDRTDRNGSTASARYTLAQLKLDHGQLSSQLEVAPVTGFYNPLGLGSTAQREHNEYSMTVRLYRPGYRTQEVKSWDKGHEVLWITAPDLAAREKAIDDLLGVPMPPFQVSRGTWWELKDDKATAFGLEPGGIGRMHRDVLAFAASEYTRLVDSREASQPNNQAVRDRMRNKAQWLKSFAERPALASR